MILLNSVQASERIPFYQREALTYKCVFVQEKKGTRTNDEGTWIFLNVYNLTVSPIRFFKAKYPDT